MNHPVNIAHRGARSLAPENTLLAGELGLAHGADIWEVDVAMSMDGIPYLLHDDTLARTTDVALRYPDRAPWQSGEFSWAELQQLDAGSWFLQQDPFKQIKVGKVDRALQRRIAGEALPTLRDALSFTRDANWWINVELKDLRGTIGDSTIVATAWRLVQQMGMEERVIFSSFNHDYLRALRSYSSRLSLGALVSIASNDPVALLAELDAQAYHPPLYDLPTVEQVDALHQADKQVFVWTVNDVGSARLVLKRGVDGLFTDFPQDWGLLSS
ncbi:MAG: hypothetical protein KDD73_12545 [Anaerolineales bacterium]|nr:hypothetical protein [Anaerolineales bacterium]MCB9127071.1 glycerophosphodiester phosphodiesterase [Ardenticatenales bacterium]MCB9172404.1 glycerophosphodiester phosphodiesterase [Ardenticatenales bacterium]